MVSQNFYMMIEINKIKSLHNFPYWSWPKFVSFELEDTSINMPVAWANRSKIVYVDLIVFIFLYIFKL